MDSTRSWHRSRVYQAAVRLWYFQGLTRRGSTAKMFSRSSAGIDRPVSASSAAANNGRAAVGRSSGDGSARSLTDRAISLKLAPPNILLATSSFSLGPGRVADCPPHYPNVTFNINFKQLQWFRHETKPLMPRPAAPGPPPLMAIRAETRPRFPQRRCPSSRALPGPVWAAHRVSRTARRS